jgi:TolB-like protein/Tfp pilus assembly protein PilF
VTIYRLSEFVLDTDRVELTGPWGAVSLEPKAYALLLLLLERRGSVVGKEEAIELIWDGRFVSDAAVSTVVKSLRRALGDDGEAQRVIRTVRGRGWRLATGVDLQSMPAVAAAPSGSSLKAPEVAGTEPLPLSAQPRLAILPFRRLGAGDDGLAVVADAVPSDLIAGISRLRWLRVVAQESSFQFRGPDLIGLGLGLGATYALSGTIEHQGRRVLVSVELSDLRSQSVVWADQFQSSLDNFHETRRAIGMAVLSVLELQIPLHEAMLARSRPSEMLDAWGAYHLGLAHIFHFTEEDNAVAAGHFERATRLDPLFASAFAALSFTSYQRAAMAWGSDRERAISETRAHAERGLELDPLDPFANLSQGRFHLLLNRPEDGKPWLDRAVRLSPSYAKGHYSRGFADMLSGRMESCIVSMDRAIELSPLDPMLCAMQACKAVAYLAKGDSTTALEWANRGARAPHAHIAMLMTAVATSQVAGDEAAVRDWLNMLAARYPDASVERFFTVLPFTDPALRSLLSDALLGAGVPR